MNDMNDAIAARAMRAQFEMLGSRIFRVEYLVLNETGFLRQQTLIQPWTGSYYQSQGQS